MTLQRQREFAPSGYSRRWVRDIMFLRFGNPQSHMVKRIRPFGNDRRLIPLSVACAGNPKKQGARIPQPLISRRKSFKISHVFDICLVKYDLSFAHVEHCPPETRATLIKFAPEALILNSANTSHKPCAHSAIEPSRHSTSRGESFSPNSS